MKHFSGNWHAKESNAYWIALRYRLIFVFYLSISCDTAPGNINLRLKNVCWFVWVFSSHSRCIYLYGIATITREGPQILTYTRHSWPFNSEGSLACQTNCDTGHLFIIVISEDPWKWSCHYLCSRLCSVAIGDQLQAWENESLNVVCFDFFLTQKLIINDPKTCFSLSLNLFYRLSLWALFLL